MSFMFPRGTKKGLILLNLAAWFLAPLHLELEQCAAVKEELLISSDCYRNGAGDNKTESKTAETIVSEFMSNILLSSFFPNQTIMSYAFIRSYMKQTGEFFSARYRRKKLSSKIQYCVKKRYIKLWDKRIRRQRNSEGNRAIDLLLLFSSHAILHHERG